MRLALLLFMTACASRPLQVRPPAKPTPASEENPHSGGVSSLLESHAPGEGRPLTETRRFDLDALPRAIWGPPTGTRFDLSTTSVASTVSFHIVVHGIVFAELDVFGARPEEDFAAYTGSFFTGQPPACGQRKGSRAVRWTGLRDGWTDDGVNIELGRGDLDLATCRTTGSAGLRARASAIVPGWVYALRVVDRGRESLDVFLPRGTLVSAGGDPRSPLQTSSTGAFTRLTLPLEETGSASATARVSPSALDAWNQMRKPGRAASALEERPPSENLLISFDVVRQRDSTTATISFALPMESKRSAYAGLL